MSLLDNVVLGERPVRRQYDGPQPAKVVRVTGGELWVALESAPTVEHRCSWAGPRGLSAPPAGARCLVLFAGAGVADPWVTVIAGWNP